MVRCSEVGWNSAESGGIEDSVCVAVYGVVCGGVFWCVVVCCRAWCGEV